MPKLLDSKVNAKLVGDKELRRAMEQLRTRGKRNKVTRPAVREATKPIRTDMKANAPVGPTGKLKRSIKSVFRTGKTGIYSITGPEYKTHIVDGRRVNPSNYAHLVEFGTSPHVVAARGLALSDGGSVFGRSIAHPGTTGKGFMRRAYDMNRATANRILKTRTFEEIKKEVAKLNAKYGKAGRR